MLRLIARAIPPPVHRLLYRVAHHVRRLGIRHVVAELHGCAMVVRDGEGRFLLVRHSYGPRSWVFPGGGMKRGEDPLETARRELGEELGCGLRDARLAAIQRDDFYGVPHVVHVVTGTIDGEPAPDRREILAARFFHRAEFPADVSVIVPRRLAALDSGSQQG